MIAKLLPLIFLVLGAGAGAGARLFLAPSHEEAGLEEGHVEAKTEAKEETDDEVPSDSEFVKMDNQFVIPVVSGDRVTSLVVVTLSIETKIGLTEAVYAREPKLRDLFLRVMFEHANMGGFRGAFTRTENMDLLRTALREVAKKEMGEDIRNVLIVDITRQDS